MGNYIQIQKLTNDFEVCIVNIQTVIASNYCQIIQTVIASNYCQTWRPH